MCALVVAVTAAGAANGQTVTWSGGNTTWTQPDSDSWSATYNSGNTAVFAGSGTGTVTISGTVTPGQINVTAGGYTFAGGVIDGSGGITKSGGGTLTLTGSNNYSGATSITGGAITIQNGSALGSTAAGTTVASGATLQIQGGITVTGESLSLVGSLINVSGSNAWAGNIAINDLTTPTRITSDAGNLLISGSVTLSTSGSAAVLGIQGAGTVEISGNISGGFAGNQSFFRSSTGSGTTTLSGNNTYLGYTSLNSGGSVIVRGGSAIPDTSLVAINGSAGLVLQSNETIGSLISGSAATGTISLGANTLTINADPAAPANPFNNGAAGAFWSAINGSGGIVKTGSGRLTLNNASTYSGATTISGGTLALGANGTIGSSTMITVGSAGSSGAVLDLTAKTGTFAFTSGQTVGGIGTLNIGAGKTVSVAGIWAPGNSIGSNAVTGNLSLSGTSQFELGTPGTSTSAPGNSDFTAVSGTLTLGGALTLLDNAGANGNGSAAGGVYQLFTYGNAVSGSYASVTTNPTATTRTSLSNISYGGSGTGSGQGVFLSVYNLAAGSVASGTTVNFGTVLKNTPLSQTLSITNTAANNAFSEKLGSAFGASTGLASGSGAWSLLSAGGTSTALSVVLSSGSAGPASGSQTLNYTSDGAGSSGLSAVSVGSQTVNLTATILDPAVASFGSGPGATTSRTLDFLTVNQGDVISPLSFNIYNLLQAAGYTADLALLSITPDGGNNAALTTNLTTFNSLASGTFNSWQASVNTANTGTFSNSWTLAFKSSNGGTVYSGDTTQSLTLTANVIVVPEPGALVLAGVGIAAAAWARRRRSHKKPGVEATLS